MARIAGIDIPKDKRGEIALQKITGIGRSLAGKILDAVSIDKNRRAETWTEADYNAIRKEIEANYIVEGALRGAVRSARKRLRDINSYRGKRHNKRLPVNGQRTRTNARTLKGPRKTVAGKRK